MQNKKTIQINQRIPTSLYLCIALNIILELKKNVEKYHFHGDCWQLSYLFDRPLDDIKT